MIQDLFHVHTYRCGHAGEETDEQYIKAAIELGAKSITFTDHGPFPGDEIPWRMPMALLDDYVTGLSALKEKYKGVIDVHIGLEVEYQPSSVEHYKNLLAIPEIEFLLLGQHICEYEPGVYSHMGWRPGTRRMMGDAIITAMRSGMFPVIAHPDRIFNCQEDWNESFEEIAKDIITAAQETGVWMEQNEGSKDCGRQYRPQFWELAERMGGVKIIHGLDAHSTADLKRRALRIE